MANSSCGFRCSGQFARSASPLSSASGSSPSLRKCFQSDTRLSSPELGDSVSRRYSHVKRRSVVQNDVRKLVVHTHEMPFGRELDRELKKVVDVVTTLQKNGAEVVLAAHVFEAVDLKRPNQSWVAVIAWLRNEATRFSVASRREHRPLRLTPRLPRDHSPRSISR